MTSRLYKEERLSWTLPMNSWFVRFSVFYYLPFFPFLIVFSTSLLFCHGQLSFSLFCKYIFYWHFSSFSIYSRSFYINVSIIGFSSIKSLWCRESFVLVLLPLVFFWGKAREKQLHDCKSMHTKSENKKGSSRGYKLGAVLVGQKKGFVSDLFLAAVKKFRRKGFVPSSRSILLALSVYSYTLISIAKLLFICVTSSFILNPLLYMVWWNCWTYQHRS